MWQKPLFLSIRSLVLLSTSLVAVVGCKGTCTRGTPPTRHDGGITEDATKPQWSLLIYVERPKPIDTLVELKIELQNMTSRPLVFPVESKWSTFDIQVTKDGKAVPRTRFGLHVVTDAGGAGVAVPMVMQPNQRLIWTLRLNRIFDLSCCSPYSVTVRKRISDTTRSTSVELVSNVVEFSNFEDSL